MLVKLLKYDLKWVYKLIIVLIIFDGLENINASIRLNLDNNSQMTINKININILKKLIINLSFFILFRYNFLSKLII